MVTPLSLKEQIKTTAFKADFKTGMLFSQSEFDAVWMIKKGRVVQGLSNL